MYRSLNGFTNLMTHLRRFHPSYEAEAEVVLRSQNALRLHIVDQRTSDIYRWIEWIVADKLPFSFCERRLARQNAKMGSICSKTLKIYMGKLYTRMEDAMKRTLPEKFGLVLDGWTSGSRHYMAIFAVFDDGCALSVDKKKEEYYDDLDCPSLRFCFWHSLPSKMKTISVPKSIGRREGALPLIGCASHKFNLAMKDFLVAHESVVDRIHTLMKQLTTLKGRAMLRRVMPLAPVLRNETRWSSVFTMVERYCTLEPSLRSLGHDTVTEHGLGAFLLTRRENESARALLQDLQRLEGVTQTLQRSSLTLSGARRHFDRVVEAFPQLKDRLVPTAAIVNHSSLESGIIKLQRIEPLNASERSARACFK